jgi:hypothetical protein
MNKSAFRLTTQSGISTGSATIFIRANRVYEPPRIRKARAAGITKELLSVSQTPE